MRSHPKASSAGSTMSQSAQGSSVRGAFATRGASGDADGSDAPSRLPTRLAALVVAITALLAAAAPAGAEIPTHPALSTLSHPVLTRACGVATDSAGNLFVSEINTGATPPVRRVSVYPPDGSSTPLTSFSTEGLLPGSPCRLAVDSSDRVYVLNATRKQVVRFAPSSTPLTSGTTYPLDTTLNGTGTLVSGAQNSTFDVAVDPATQNVYLARPGQISSYEPNGTLISETIGNSVSGAQYTGVDVYGKNGNVYATDETNKKAYVFNPAGSAILAEWDGSESPVGAFAFEGLGQPDVAVDQSDGHAYISDVREHHAVVEFDGAGSFVSILSHSPPFEHALPSAVAVDRGASSPNQGTVYLTAYPAGSVNGVEEAGVFAFGPLVYGKSLTVVKAGPGTGTVSGGSIASPSAIECGSTCQASFPEGAEVVLIPTPDAGSSFGGWSGCDSVTGNECHVTMSDHKTVTATFLTPQLTVSKTGSGSGTITSAPAGINCGASCQSYFPEGAEVTLTQSAASGSKFKEWSGCDSVVGEECKVTMGADRSVSADFVAEPAISATEATAVGASGATLNAKVNPGGSATTWHFEYTDDADFQANGFANAIKVPVPDASAEDGTANVAVSRSITGLSDSTTYHFRLVATNFASPAQGTAGPEVSFTTYLGPPAPEPCDNDLMRVGPSAKLPDCRAYEQASQVDKNGMDALKEGNTMAAASDGDAVIYYSRNGEPGGLGPDGSPWYIAQRRGGRWSTNGLYPPISYGDQTEIRGWLPDLSTVFLSDLSLGIGNGNPFLLARQSSGGALTTISNMGFGTFVGASEDGSIVYLQGEASFGEELPSSEGVPGKPNLYAWDRDTNTLRLAGVLPDSACATPPCLPLGGSEVQRGGGVTGGGYPVANHAVTSTGDAYFTDPFTGQLYLRKDPFGPNPETVHVSGSHRTDCAEDPGSCTGDPDPQAALPATFQAASSDGEHAFFTSTEELTDDANTGPSVDPPAIGRVDLPDPLATPPCDTEPCNIQKNRPFLLNTPPGSMAADAEHLYWIEPGTGSIARSELDGTNVKHDFITGIVEPQDLTVDSEHIYWTEGGPLNNRGFEQNGLGTIGRADLPASPGDPVTNVEPDCITGLTAPRGIDVNETLGFVYFLNQVQEPVEGADGSMARADISGSCEAANSSKNLTFGNYSTSAGIGDLVVNDTYIYTSAWDSYFHKVLIQRFNIANGSFEKQFTLNAPLPTRAALAVDDSHLYFGNSETGAIGRAELDLTNVDESFLTGLTAPVGLALGQGADAGHLYWATGLLGGGRGNDLYRWDAGSGDLTDLTPDSTDELGAEVRAVLGASEDGDYVYFVANADLDEDGEATPGDCSGSRLSPASDLYIDFKGQCSIYYWHAGDPHPTFVARLDTSQGYEEQSDVENWIPSGAGTENEKLARVSADGKTLLFRSEVPLTGYDNEGSVCEHGSSGRLKPGRCPELYRFNTEDGLTCVSCDPTGAPPLGPARESQMAPGFPHPRTPVETLTRNLSPDGNRIFFETPDKLVAADVNGDSGCPQTTIRTDKSPIHSCIDVYEWEAEGTGSCHSSDQNGGCLYLISPGTTAYPSFFLDASEDGEDAFIITRDQLVPQDTDTLFDVYDASAGGGLAYQHAVAPALCEGDACREARTQAPNSQGAASGVFQGPGNSLAKAPECAKGERKVRRAGKVRCLKRKGHHRKRHRHQTRHNRTAKNDRRASR